MIFEILFGICLGIPLTFLFMWRNDLVDYNYDKNINQAKLFFLHKLKTEDFSKKQIRKQAKLFLVNPMHKDIKNLSETFKHYWKTNKKLKEIPDITYTTTSSIVIINKFFIDLTNKDMTKKEIQEKAKKLETEILLNNQQEIL